MLDWIFTKAYAVFDPLSVDIPNNTKFDSVEDFLYTGVGLLFDFVGLAALVALVYSGIMYITAGSDQNKAEAAKKNITWTVIGIVIALLVYFIITQVMNILSGGN